jgi:CheY-like chemotaxis protein
MERQTTSSSDFRTNPGGAHPPATLDPAVRIEDRGTGHMPTKVLVVDDDPDLVAICSLILESEGYTVESARNGSEAVDKLQDHDDIDLVLLDVMMPVLDGLSVCKMVKRDPRTKDLPVVLISASSVLREKGKHLADAVIEKPFDIDDLITTVGHFAPAV